MRQQPAFALDAAAVAGQRPISADHAMARHHDADRVGPVGRPNRANRTGPSEFRSQRAVAERLAWRDRREAGPYRALERRAGGTTLDRRETSEVAIEIT